MKKKRATRRTVEIHSLRVNDEVIHNKSHRLATVSNVCAKRFAVDQEKCVQRPMSWSRVRVGDMSWPLSVATVNLFNGRGKDMAKNLMKRLGENKPDIVALQEIPLRVIDIRGYTPVVWQELHSTEKMGMLLRDDGEWEVVDRKRKHETKKCRTPRMTFIVTLQHKQVKHVKVKIANIHLCGGSIDEKWHQGKSNILATKTEAVEFAVQEDCDIILGDFNSDAQHFETGRARHGQKKYLKNLGWSEDQIETWNCGVFRYLQGQGYSLVPPEEQTSYFETTPDVVTYKVGQFHLRGRKLLDMGATGHNKGQYYGASDHNGVYAEFQVTSVTLKPTYPKNTRTATDTPINLYVDLKSRYAADIIYNAFTSLDLHGHEFVNFTGSTRTESDLNLSLNFEKKEPVYSTSIQWIDVECPTEKKLTPNITVKIDCRASTPERRAKVFVKGFSNLYGYIQDLQNGVVTKKDHRALWNWLFSTLKKNPTWTVFNENKEVSILHFKFRS